MSNDAETREWEDAVNGRLEGVANFTEGHTANCRQERDAEVSMLKSGAEPGTGFMYHGRGTTYRVIYRSKENGFYWDIVYRRKCDTDPWRLQGVERWRTSHSLLGPDASYPGWQPTPPEVLESLLDPQPCRQAGCLASPEAFPPVPAGGVAAPPPIEPAGGAGAPP